MNRNSDNYLKTTYSSKIYGNDNSTTCEKELIISGKEKDYVDSHAGWIKRGVMP